MARTPEGWKLGNRKPYHVRFTHEGRRYDVSTKTSEIGAAKKAAATIYAEVISGRVRRAASGALVKASTELAVIAEEWLEETAKEYAPGSEKIREVYVRHWVATMPTVGAVTTAGIGDYQRKRLGQVRKVTLRKELSTLRRFLAWCVERKVLRAEPEFPKLPRKALGTPVPTARRKPTEVLTPDQVEAILAVSGYDPFLVVCWETALRPISTVAKLRRDDLTAFGLRIRPEASKNGTSRTVPVTERARVALETALPFGAGDRNPRFKAAADKVLGEGHGFTLYGLKHARITQLVNEGMPLSGISQMADVSIKTLVGSYVHASRLEAERIVNWCNGGAKEAKVQDSSRNAVGSDSQCGYFQGEQGADSPGNHGQVAPTSATDDPVVVPLHHKQTYRDTSLPALVRVALWRRAVA